MATHDEQGQLSRTERNVFHGLTPTPTAKGLLETARPARNGLITAPLVVASAMAITLSVAAPAEGATPVKKAEKTRADLVPQSPSQQSLTAPTARSVPASYRVERGDTVSAIAARHGLPTSSVLALNGLGWNTLIFPGQVLKLSAETSSTPPAPPSSTPSGETKYTIARGDTISGIAARHGVATQGVLDANGLGWHTIIYPGQVITIPGSASSTPTPTQPAPAPTNPAPTPSPAPSPSPAPVEPVASEPEPEPDVVLDDIPSTPVVTAPPPAANNAYTIQRGDTISAIARSFGVTVQSILDANSLRLSSIIYAGATLVIPGVVDVPKGPDVTPLSAEMAANADIIIAVGRSIGVPDRGIVIALAAAMQESSLRNISFGDRDSLGLFQQRPSTGWGTRDELLDAVHATRLFYGGPTGPNVGTRGLLDIPNWQSLTLTQAAQAVQISGHPTAYAKWETSAAAWLAERG